MLCSVDVAVIIFGNNKKLYEYSSSDIGEILQRYNFVRENNLTNSHLVEHRPLTFPPRSMEVQMNIKALPILMEKGILTMTMTMMITWDLHRTTRMMAPL